MNEDKPHDDSKRAARRGFLAAAASVPALAAAARWAKQPAGAAAPAAVTDSPEAARGYHETEHIRKYYSTAAF